MIAVRLFPAWEVVVRRQLGHEEVKMLAQTTATFSVGLCVKSAESGLCQITEIHTVHVVGITHVVVDNAFKHTAIDVQL